MRLGREVDLLNLYPKSKRDSKERAQQKTPEDRRIAREYGEDFFDGNRRHGYGGFYYDPRFWTPVIPTFVNFYNLGAESTVLDIGCAKGFMLFDLIGAVPGISVRGIDISRYAIDNALPKVRAALEVASAVELPFKDNAFDLVISINTLHNLEGAELKQAFSEITRVSKKDAFITVDAYETMLEKEAMFEWNQTAKTILSVDRWKEFFIEVGYEGDFFWFKP